MENVTVNVEKRKQPEESSEAVDTQVKNQDLASKRQRVVAWKYDVFLSFRGEDIRKGFIDHLFTDFKRNGIYAFRDNIDLPRGEQISSQLYTAIESSRFLMVIFSKNYASSSWCLRELVKIIDSRQMEKPKHEVRILFYDVKPEVVRKQTESYAEAFAKHEVSNRAEVDEWRRALGKAADLAGMDLNDMTNGYESRFIDYISKEICKALCDGPLHVGENLVGVHARVNKLNLMRFRGSSKVNMIGIYGISGIGKTTLAKAIYNSMYTYFEGSCFCEDVAKRQDLTQVQTQLINKIMKSEDAKIHGKSEGVEIIKRRVGRDPILVVLDDVDHREQLEALAGSHDWFCPGSMIILTGKDKQLLTSHGADEIYEMEFLDAYEDIELFCLYAFRQTYPTNDFKHLAYQAVNYLQGHPLALKVVGSALFGSCERIWRSELDRLQTHPNSEIQQKLRPSFELLDFHHKRIFLDIACSLIGENLDFCASVLSIDCSADANINVLVNKSLITISPDGSLLQMHELIRSMAMEVLREEPYRPIWLCGSSQVYAVLGENNVTQTTKAVEVLILLLEKSTKTVHIDCEAFSKMENLRILKICNREPKDFEESFQLPVNFSGRLVFLSNELRLMCWHGYPFKSLPSDFYPENVVAIDLSYSSIKSFWTTPKCFERLKVMKLRHCRNLTTTPDFTEMTNLEKLILEGCVNLVKLHPSIGILKKLVMLNMRDCTKIRSIPCKVELDSLQVLILPGCFKTDIPTQVFSTLKSLVKPNADETAMTGFPSFISSLTNLQVLEINNQQAESPTWWKSIFQKQPQSLVLPSLASLRLLTEIKLKNCNISEVCDDIGALSCLSELYLDHNNFTKLPESLGELSRLRTLSLTGCKKLEVIPKFPPHLYRFQVSQCTSLQELPRQIPRRSMFTCFCIDCPKILGNVTIDSQVSTSQTNRFIELLGIESQVREFFSGGGGSFNTGRKLYMVLQGNRIPEWFTNRSKENHVKVELPPHWCYSKFKGFALCAVYTVKANTLYGPRCNVENFNGASLSGTNGWGFRYNRDSHNNTMIWYYFSTCIGGWEEAENFVTFKFFDGYRNENIDWKEFGVRLVCEDEDRDIKVGETLLSMIQHLPPLKSQPTNNNSCIFYFKDSIHDILVMY